jgi:S-adenosylmethionine decarboxylase
MNVGTEWFIDAEGCLADRLQDSGVVRRICEQIVHELDLHVVGDALWHKFPDAGGVTGLFLLTESHLACHTYPEVGIATFNLYCCRPRPRWAWEEHLAEALGAERVTVRCAVRGQNNVEPDFSDHIAVERERNAR